MMTQIFDFPPNIDQIAKVFPNIKNKSGVFTFGDIIFNPHRGYISDDLVAHETVHTEQQFRHGGPLEWWNRYLKDPDFRLNQEAQAYRAQYNNSIKWSRTQRRKLLQRLIRDFSGKMYGNIISSHGAKLLIY